MNFTDPDNITEHPTYLLADKIAKICAPLFNNFPINYFSYGRKYKGNTIVIPVSSKDWLRHYAQNNYPLLSKNQKIHSWATTMPPKAIEEAASFNLYNGIMLEKVHADYTETMEFASPNETASPLEFCSNKELLNQFFLYFRDKAKNIIATLEKEPLCFPENRFLKPIPADQSCVFCYTTFCQAINTKKVQFKLKTNDISFSRREFEVLRLLAQGKSMAETSDTLKLSCRTVETYLYRARNKTNLSTVSQLLDIFTDSLF